MVVPVAAGYDPTFPQHWNNGPHNHIGLFGPKGNGPKDNASVEKPGERSPIRPGVMPLHP